MYVYLVSERFAPGLTRVLLLDPLATLVKCAAAICPKWWLNWALLAESAVEMIRFLLLDMCWCRILSDIVAIIKVISELKWY